MKKHKVERIIKKQGGNAQVVFRDGTSVFWPRDERLTIGTTVREHKHKNGQTVAYSWRDNIRFVLPQSFHFDESVDFVEKFGFFDQLSFNNALRRALNFYVEGLIFPDSEKIAHNIILFGLQSQHGKSR